MSGGGQEWQHTVSLVQVLSQVYMSQVYNLCHGRDGLESFTVPEAFIWVMKHYDIP